MSDIARVATNVKPDIDEIKRAASVLCNGLTELRILSGRRVISGYYTDYDRLAQDAAAQNHLADGVYVIPNAIRHDLLARSANHLKEAKSTTADVDIIARRWLLVDIDPKRPAGISSDDIEHNVALALAYQTRDWLIGFGISKDSVVLGDSGNGAHVLVRLEDLSNDDLIKGTVTNVLQLLSDNLSDGRVGVDLTTFNAARIWKLYGTVARKGDSTSERPHRLSRMIEVPLVLVPAPLVILKAMSSLVPKTAQTPANTKIPVFDLETWMQDHGLTATRKEPYQGGTRYILQSCPFNAEHSGTSSAVFQLRSGAIVFVCKHNGCAGRKWEDVRELKEPGYRRAHVNNGNTVSSINSPESKATASERYKSVTESVTKSRAEAIENWIKETSGWFSYDDIDREFGIRSEAEKLNRRVIVKRLKDAGKLESHPKNNKLLRYVNVTVRLIDFRSAMKRAPLALRFPFGIERYFHCYPGNIIVVAGAADAGKTAFLLNLVRLNQLDFSIFYQSSEMGREELASRLEHFEGITLDQWNFTAEERSHDFADVIRPDCVNIIDYMELSGDFYNVAEYLRAIHDKLATGIAVVALQKKRDAALGRGGDFGLEKPRLYLSMDSGRLTIQKAKNWTDPKSNPNGLVVNFKIVGGCRFMVTQDWHNDEEWRR